MVAFIHAIPATVTPTIELAKLELVTSRDEEENEADKGSDWNGRRFDSQVEYECCAHGCPETSEGETHEARLIAQTYI
jgi:hypothetical protein